MTQGRLYSFLQYRQATMFCRCRTEQLRLSIFAQKHEDHYFFPMNAHLGKGTRAKLEIKECIVGLL